MRAGKGKYVVAVVLLLALAAAMYLWPRTPNGQPPLTIITQSNMQQFRAAFEDTGSDMKLLLLVSPT
jgi:hypothetical protein